MRIVLDTNCLLISIPKKSKYRIVFDSLLQKKFTLVISNEILSEYEEKISEKSNALVAKNISEMLTTLSNVEKRDVYYRWNLIQRDYDDNKFVDCAIAGNVDYLVTNDTHFSALKQIEFPTVNVISINEFIITLQST